jgi:hypothetical protein
MKGGGDFSNNFDRHMYRRKHFTRVLTQQGRVQLDADGNEQAAILWHYLQTLARDLIGPHGGPFSKEPGFEVEPGFKIVLFPDQRGAISDLCIGHGRYYVDGLLCENEEKLYAKKKEDPVEPVTYYNQPGYPLNNDQDPLPDPPFLVYLDVWERHITAIEDPTIREVALDAGGPDTATRAKLVWQVKIMTGVAGADFPDARDGVEDRWNEWVKKWQPPNRGELKAMAKEETDDDTNPCIVSPEASYRGIENQLYRVEIHRGGAAWDGSTESRETAATFKWSRENGSVAFPIEGLPGKTLTLEHLGRDSRLSLKVGDLVEIEDDDYILKGLAEPLLAVEAVDPIDMQVTLDRAPDGWIGQNPEKYRLLRRWDHGDEGSKKGVVEQDTLLIEEDTWLELEDGVQICFQSPTELGIVDYTAKRGDRLNHIAKRSGIKVEELLCLNPHIADPDEVLVGRTLKLPNTAAAATSVEHEYRTGDYWLIPARAVTGDVEWPKDDKGHPEAQPPHGTEHHYAPLAVVVSDQDNPAGKVVDCRHKFRPLGK